jgi:hypothetical protein
VEFEKKLALNRKLAETDIKKADFDLLEYDRLTQSPNDASSIDFKVEVLKKYLP